MRHSDMPTLEALVVHDDCDYQDHHPEASEICMSEYWCVTECQALLMESMAMLKHRLTDER